MTLKIQLLGRQPPPLPCTAAVTLYAARQFGVNEHPSTKIRVENQPCRLRVLSLMKFFTPISSSSVVPNSCSLARSAAKGSSSEVPEDFPKSSAEISSRSRVSVSASPFRMNRSGKAFAIFDSALLSMGFPLKSRTRRLGNFNGKKLVRGFRGNEYQQFAPLSTKQ